MTEEPRKDPHNLPPPERASGDASYAEAYAAGYGEGLRESLKELLQHASRGHTATELRILVESRLARVPEDVELKRKSLLNPPRRTAWNSWLRPPAPPTAGTAPAASPPELPTFVPGSSYLFREERPRLGPRFVATIAAQHAGGVWVSSSDPPDPHLLIGKWLTVRPSARPSGNGNAPGGGPGEVAGRIQEATGPGGLLVYLDTLEMFLTEHGSETTLKFATWLGGWAKENRSTAVVSVDPGAFSEQDRRRLQRAFNILA